MWDWSRLFIMICGSWEIWEIMGLKWRARCRVIKGEGGRSRCMKNWGWLMCSRPCIMGLGENHFGVLEGKWKLIVHYGFRRELLDWENYELWLERRISAGMQKLRNRGDWELVSNLVERRYWGICGSGDVFGLRKWRGLKWRIIKVSILNGKWRTRVVGFFAAEDLSTRT